MKAVDLATVTAPVPISSWARGTQKRLRLPVERLDQRRAIAGFGVGAEATIR
jgi:hypothetical protein